MQARDPGLALGYTCGQESLPSHTLLRSPLLAIAGDLGGVLQTFRSNPLFRDARDDLLKNVGDDFTQFPAPWAYCWTTAVSIPADRAPRFDETFEAKGTEDLEWGYRCCAAEIPMTFVRDGPVVHVPHSRDRRKDTAIDRRNVQRFLRKFPNLEVENFAAFDCGNVNRLLPPVFDLLTSLAVEAPVPDEALLAELALTRPGPRLAVGFPNDIPSWADAATYPRRAMLMPASMPNTLPLLGYALPFDTASFGVVVLSSFWTLLPEQLLVRVFQESLRVGRHVLLYAPAQSPAPCSRVEWEIWTRPFWSQAEHFSRELEEFDVSLLRAGSDGAVLGVQWASLNEGPGLESLVDEDRFPRLGIAGSE
jgi:hypothetical protein